MEETQLEVEKRRLNVGNEPEKNSFPLKMVQTLSAELFTSMNNRIVQDLWYPKSCPGCSKRFPTKAIFSQHVDFNCQSANIFDHNKVQKVQNQEVKADKKKTNKNGEKVIECQVCYRKITQEFAYVEHMRKYHPEFTEKLWPFRCKNCHRTFPDQEKLERHQSRKCIKKKKFYNEADKDLECQVCNKKFNMPFAYITHMRKSHQEFIEKSWIPCKSCQRHFPDQEKLDRHRSNFCTAEQSSVSSSENGSPRPADNDDAKIIKENNHDPKIIRQHTCQICKKQSNNVFQYMDHMREKHPFYIRVSFINRFL